MGDLDDGRHGGASVPHPSSQVRELAVDRRRSHWCLIFVLCNPWSVSPRVICRATLHPCYGLRELAYVLGDAQPVEVLVAQPEHHELLSPLAADVDAHMRVRPCVARVGALTNAVGDLSCLHHAHVHILSSVSNGGTEVLGMLAPQSIEELADNAPQPLLARSMDILLNGDGSGQRQSVIDQRAALMIYTSGTTGRPKGELWQYAALPCVW